MSNVVETQTSMATEVVQETVIQISDDSTVAQALKDTHTEVNKAITAQMSNEESTGADEEAATEEPTSDEPATEEAATEEAVTEEAATEEVATEEAVTEEVATEEPAVSEEAASEEAASEETPSEEVTKRPAEDSLEGEETKKAKTD